MNLKVLQAGLGIVFCPLLDRSLLCYNNWQMVQERSLRNLADGRKELRNINRMPLRMLRSQICLAPFCYMNQ